MVTALLQKALRRSLDQVRHVSPIRRDGPGGFAARAGGASDTVAQVYRQAEQDFGMLAPPLALHSPAAGPLAASWMMLRESLLADGTALRGRPRKPSPQRFRSAIPARTASPCTRRHCPAWSAPDRRGGVRRRHRLHPRSRDPGNRPLGTPVGHRPDSEACGVPFSREQAPEIAGVAVTFHYLNRMVDIFLPDSPLPPNVPALARGGALRMLGRFMSSAARADHQPGASLDLLPAAPLPQDLHWAAGNPHVAEAFARAGAAIEAAGQQHVPASVQAVLHARLAGWDGQPLGPSRSWVQDEVSALPPASGPPAGWCCSPPWPPSRSTSRSSTPSGPTIRATRRWSPPPRGPAWQPPARSVAGYPSADPQLMSDMHCHTPGERRPHQRPVGRNVRDPSPIASKVWHLPIEQATFWQPGTAREAGQGTGSHPWIIAMRVRYSTRYATAGRRDGA